MKLTNLLRDNFINRVLKDVPREKFAELTYAAVHKEYVASMPKLFQHFWEVKEFRNLLSNNCRHETFYPLCDVFLPTPFDFPPELTEELKVMARRARSQEDQRTNIKASLKAGIYACSTLKQAQEMFPDLLKYLPEEVVPKKLPIVRADVTVEMLKKAGWPKGEATT